MTDGKLHIAGAEVPDKKELPPLLPHTAVTQASDRRASVKSLAADVLLWALLCILLIAGIMNVHAVSGRYPSISMRFDTPVSGRAAYAARQYSIEQGGQEIFWPTFWSEDRLSFSSAYATVEADSILFSGDAALVWPASYVAGAPPGVTDTIGCALSATLAWRLWGSLDVVGRDIEVNGETRIVRGVFEEESELAFVSLGDEDTSASWHVVELAGGPANATGNDAETYAVSSGLGRADAVLVGGGPIFLCGAMAVLPLLILAGYGLALVSGWLWKRYAAARLFFLFALLVGFAVSLPSLLAALPDWLIPGQWSDFSFWASLTEELGSGLREFFGATPRMRDVEGKMLLLKQAGIAFGGAAVAFATCFRWHWKHQSFVNRLY